MSAGPIQKWRDGMKVDAPAPVTAKTTHMVNDARTAYCGRRGVTMTIGVEKVDCADCLAALRADGLIP